MSNLPLGLGSSSQISSISTRALHTSGSGINTGTGTETGSTISETARKLLEAKNVRISLDPSTFGGNSTVPYSDIHRLMAQAFLSNPFLYFPELLRLYRWVLQAVTCPVPNPPIKLSIIIGQINQKLEALNFRVNERIDPFTGKKFWTLINLDNSNSWAKATSLNKFQIPVASALLLEIIDTPTCTLDYETARSFDPEIENLKVDIVITEAIITNLIENSWLIKFNDISNKYYLTPHPRCFAELEDWITSSLPRFKAPSRTCFVCKRTVFCGHKCSCGSFTHHHCIKILERAIINTQGGDDTPEVKCPKCFKEFTNITDRFENIKTDLDVRLSVISESIESSSQFCTVKEYNPRIHGKIKV